MEICLVIEKTTNNVVAAFNDYIDAAEYIEHMCEENDYCIQQIELR